MARSIQQWARDASDDVQYACNLSGLVFAFQRCIAELVAEAERCGQDESWIDRHPICVAWADKLDDLSRSRGLAAIPTDNRLVDLVSNYVERMRDICEEAIQQNQGTDWRNQHPEVQQFVRKMVFVTRSREGMNIMEALDRCERIARGESVPEERGT